MSLYHHVLPILNFSSMAIPQSINHGLLTANHHGQVCTQWHQKLSRNLMIIITMRMRLTKSKMKQEERN
jgi:hypothetical protein